MSNTPRNLTRNQLAEFLPNARAVRAFEQLLKQVGELLPSDVATLNRLIQESFIEGSSASAKAQSALDILEGVVNDLTIDADIAGGKATQALNELRAITLSLALLAYSPPRQTDNAAALDYIDFNANPKFSMTPGRVHWGPTGTLEIEMGGGNITQQVGEEIFVYGKATAAITEGQLIMVTGALGASGVLTFAPTATGLTDPNAILGVATENLALNAFGRVTIIGIVHGINTTGSSVGEVWADGDVLWYNPSFVGGMTKVKPSAPNMKTQVAIVINAGVGSGSLQVEVLHGSTLGGTDSNVQLGALVDKQILQYDAAAGYWKNVAIASASTVSLTDDTTTNATMYPVWSTAASGSVPLKATSTKMTFNPSTGVLTVTGLTTGSDATINGLRVGRGNSGVASNTAVGLNTLSTITSGGSNVAVGQYCLFSATIGAQNVAIGDQAMYKVVDGQNNIGFGQQAMYQLTSGSNNIGIGYWSGFGTTGVGAVTTGSNNILIGVQTRLNVASDSNSVVLGYQAIGLGANTVVLGNSAHTDTFLFGRVRIPQYTTAGAPAYVKGAVYFDTTLNKLRIGGATAWETVTSI